MCYGGLQLLSPGLLNNVQDCVFSPLLDLGSVVLELEAHSGSLQDSQHSGHRMGGRAIAYGYVYVCVQGCGLVYYG